MKRKISIVALFLVGVLPVFSSTAPFRVDEATIADIHAGMKAGQLTAQQLVRMYLDRIEAYDKKGPYINSIITINPKAMQVARISSGHVCNSVQNAAVEAEQILEPHPTTGIRR